MRTKADTVKEKKRKCHEDVKDFNKFFSDDILTKQYKNKKNMYACIGIRQEVQL